MKVVAIYDNGGETFDRYTVFYTTPELSRRISGTDCLGMSENPFHPQGFCQHSSGQLGKHNGNRISFNDLPKDCRQAVLNDLHS